MRICEHLRIFVELHIFLYKYIDFRVVPVCFLMSTSTIAISVSLRVNLGVSIGFVLKSIN